MLLAIRFKACALVEHPAFAAYRPGSASIWNLSFIKWLLLAPTVRLHTFLQGSHGQTSPKPTTFLCVRMPSIVKYLFAHQENLPSKSKISGGLIGKNESNKYHTASAKEYPPSLCCCIAKAIIDSVVDSVDRHNAYTYNQADYTHAQQVFDSLREFYCAYDPYFEEQQQMRSDCMLFDRR